MSVSKLPSEVVHLPVVRPTIYGDCSTGPRPCPWVSCRHNLLLDVNEHGNITLNLPKAGQLPVNIKPSTPDTTFDALADEAIESWLGENAAPVRSCSLDESRREHSLEEVGGVLHMTRERVRQIEDDAKARLARKLSAADASRSSVRN